MRRPQGVPVRHAADVRHRGLDDRIRHETGMPVHVAHDPLSSVVLGSGKCVEEFEALQQVLVSETVRRGA